MIPKWPKKNKIRVKYLRGESLREFTITDSLTSFLLRLISCHNHRLGILFSLTDLSFMNHNDSIPWKWNGLHMINRIYKLYGKTNVKPIHKKTFMHLMTQQTLVFLSYHRLGQRCRAGGRSCGRRGMVFTSRFRFGLHLDDFWYGPYGSIISVKW